MQKDASAHQPRKCDQVVFVLHQQASPQELSKAHAIFKPAASDWCSPDRTELICHNMFQPQQCNAFKFLKNSFWNWFFFGLKFCAEQFCHVSVKIDRFFCNCLPFLCVVYLESFRKIVLSIQLPLAEIKTICHTDIHSLSSFWTVRMASITCNKNIEIPPMGCFCIVKMTLATLPHLVRRKPWNLQTIKSVWCEYFLYFPQKHFCSDIFFRGTFAG